MKYAAALALILAGILIPTSSWASLGGHGIGPSAGSTTAIAASRWEPTAWFLGTTSGGVYRLVSGSAEWEYLGWVLPDDGIVQDFSTSASAPGVVFAMSYSTTTGRHYVFRSINSGITWQIRGLGLPWQTSDIDCDPVDPSKAYAATALGLYRTTDAGFSWHRWALTERSIQTVAVDPSDPDRIWAAAYYTGIYRTEDAGNTWDLYTDGMSDIRDFEFLIPGDTGGRIYSLGFRNYRSTDNGTTWSPFDCCPPYLCMTHLALSAVNPDDAIAATLAWGIVRTTDGGATWATLLPPANPHIAFYNYVARDPLDAEHAIVGRGDGVVVETTDGGTSWTDRTDGISDGDVTSIDVRGSRIIAGAGGGVYVSDDGGLHWMSSDLNVDSPYVTSIALSPDGTTAFAGMLSTAQDGTGEVWRSADGGRMFSLVASTEQTIQAIAVDPVDPAIAFAASGTTRDGAILRSLNGGFDWTPVNAGNPVWCLLVDPADPSIVMAGSEGGILRSGNHGGSWSLRGPSIKFVSLSPDGADPLRFYAASEEQGVWVSEDAGLTWSQFGAGLPSLLTSVDGRDPAAGVLVGTREDQIWRNAGRGWERLLPQDQPPAVWIWCVRSTGDGRWFTGTWGAGIWEYRSDPASTPEIARNAPARLSVLGSPSQGPFKILAAALTRGPLRIEIYDPAGRLVRVRETPTPEPWIWDGRDARGATVAPGIYLIRARCRSGIESSKICVLR